MPQAKTNNRPKLHRRVHARVRHQYYRVMPNRRRHRLVVWALFLSLSMITAGQLLYPLDRALPFAQLQGRAVGGWRHDDLAARLNDSFTKSSVRILATNGKKVELPLRTLGAELETERVIAELEDYSFWQRLIPLSILWQRPNVDSTPLTFTSSVVQAVSKSAAKQLTTAPFNARLTIKDGRLQASTERYGSQISPADVRQKLLTHQNYRLGQLTVVKVGGKQTRPTATAADFSEVRQQAEAALARDIMLQINDKTPVTPSVKERAGWLEIASDKRQRPILRLRQSAVQAYLTRLDKNVGTPAGVSHISLVNGRQTAKKIGASGRAINQTKLIPRIEDYLLDGNGTIPIMVSFRSVPPRVIYNGRYTSSQAGLQAYVRDAARDQNANISIRQITGTKWSADASGSLSTVSASTYKLFVSLYLFDQMDKGRVGWNDPILDTNVTTCFDRMTIASTNPCAQEWLAQWGRSRVNSFVYAHGFSRGTTFTHPEATHTTANDLTKFMTGLENGSLIGGAHRDRLLHSLSVHPYRSGIPAGSAGRVYDKVGFLWDYTHDTAIVYHPKGTYILTVMTKGRNYATIAAITREIEAILYP